MHCWLFKIDAYIHSCCCMLGHCSSITTLQMSYCLFFLLKRGTDVCSKSGLFCLVPLSHFVWERHKKKQTTASAITVTKLILETIYCPAETTPQTNGSCVWRLYYWFSLKYVYRLLHESNAMEIVCGEGKGRFAPALGDGGQQGARWYQTTDWGRI